MWKVLLITGMIWSGKWTLSEYLSREYDALIYRFSDPLHTILNDLGMPNTRENLAKLSISLRKNFWEWIMGTWVQEFIMKHPWQFIILEWVRRIEALSEIQDLIDHTIWIESSPENRYTRIKARGEKSWESGLSREEFQKHDELETELTLQKIRDMADFTIENNWSKEEFYEKIFHYITKN